MSVLTTPRDEVGFCPGCAHLLIVQQLGAAIDRLGLEPEEVCLVTDVGCVGLADRYFNSHTFHGLHGRSVTYAEGIKHMRPDRTVIVLIGDGACGTGATHVIHAARRGVGIHVIVCNNLKLGSGVVQYAMNTAIPGRAPMLPDSDPEHPFDICRTAIANGASHVGRFSVFAPDFGAHIEAALRATGFVLVDCWEVCVSQGGPEPKLTPSGLLELAQRLGLPFGLLHDGGPRWRPTASAEPTPADGAVGYQPAQPLEWLGRAEISVVGSDGQYIRFATGVLGGIAAAGDVFVVELGDRPIVGGGYSVSNLVLSDRPIRYIGSDDPDLVVILSGGGERRLGSLGNLAPECLVVVDATLPLTPTRAKVVRIDQRALENEVGSSWAALAILAFAVVERGLIDADALLSAAQHNLTGRCRPQILDTLRLGLERVRTRTPASEGENARAAGGRNEA